MFCADKETQPVLVISTLGNCCWTSECASHAALENNFISSCSTYDTNRYLYYYFSLQFSSVSQPTTFNWLGSIWCYWLTSSSDFFSEIWGSVFWSGRGTFDLQWRPHFEGPVGGNTMAVCDITWFQTPKLKCSSNRLSEDHMWLRFLLNYDQALNAFLDFDQLRLTAIFICNAVVN